MWSNDYPPHGWAGVWGAGGLGTGSSNARCRSQVKLILKTLFETNLSFFYIFLSTTRTFAIMFIKKNFTFELVLFVLWPNEWKLLISVFSHRSHIVYVYVLSWPCTSELALLGILSCWLWSCGPGLTLLPLPAGLWCCGPPASSQLTLWIGGAGGQHANFCLGFCSSPWREHPICRS